MSPPPQCTLPQCRASYRGGVPDIVLPHAVLAALWIPRIAGDDLPRLAELPRAVAAVTGAEESHIVEPGALGARVTSLAQLLGWFAAQGPHEIGAVLPRPGHVAGLPQVVLHDALAAEQCLVISGQHGSWAAVPTSEPFGSALEPGVLVRWRVRELPPTELPAAVLLGSLGSLGEARRDVAAATSNATEALAALSTLDYPATSVTLGELPDDVLPPGLPARRLELLSRCARLLGIVQAAQTVEASLSSGEARTRRRELHELETVARRGLSTASLSLGQP